jgi:hypothetical protein
MSDGCVGIYGRVIMSRQVAVSHLKEEKLIFEGLKFLWGKTRKIQNQTQRGCLYGASFYARCLTSAALKFNAFLSHDAQNIQDSIVYVYKTNAKVNELTKSLCNSLLMNGLIFISPIKMKKHPRRIERPRNVR